MGHQLTGYQITLKNFCNHCGSIDAALFLSSLAFKFESFKTLVIFATSILKDSIPLCFFENQNQNKKFLFLSR